MKKLFLIAAVIFAAGLLLGSCDPVEKDYDDEDRPMDLLNLAEGKLPNNVTLLQNGEFHVAHTTHKYSDGTDAPAPFSLGATYNRVMGSITFWNYRAIGTAPDAEEGEAFKNGYIVKLTLPANSGVVRIQAYVDVNWLPGTPGLGAGGMGWTYAYEGGDSEIDFEVFQELPAGQYTFEWDRGDGWGLDYHRVVVRFDFKEGTSAATLNDPAHGFKFTMNEVKAY